MADLVTAEDTNEAHAKACRDLVEKSGAAGEHRGRSRRGSIARRARRRFERDLPRRDRRNGLGRSYRPIRSSATCFVNTSDYASIGWIEKMPDGSRVPYDQRSAYGSAGAFEILGSQDRRERSVAGRVKAGRARNRPGDGSPR